MAKEVEVISRERAYDGFFKMDRYTVRHDIGDGTLSEPITREVFERGQSAAILVYDPSMDAVLTVEEFRIGHLAAGLDGDDCWSLGIVAGSVEPGEEPLLCVLREAQEEAGLELAAEQIIDKVTIFPSPGGTSEMVHLFIAKADLSEVENTIRSLASEAEYTLPRAMPRQQAMEEIRRKPANGYLTTLLFRLEVLAPELRITAGNQKVGV